MTRRVASIGLALCLAACGAAGSHRRSPEHSSALARAQTTHEYPSPTPAQRAVAAVTTAPAAVAAFATAYINWSAATISRVMRVLAGRSIGQARAAVQLAAAQTASDYELQHGGLANRGSVEAVAPLRGSRDQYVVVTRELTTATATTAYQGLQPAWHLALATVTEQRPNQWVVSGWQPEN